MNDILASLKDKIEEIDLKKIKDIVFEKITDLYNFIKKETNESMEDKKPTIGLIKIAAGILATMIVMATLAGAFVSDGSLNATTEEVVDAIYNTHGLVVDSIEYKRINMGDGKYQDASVLYNKTNNFYWFVTKTDLNNKYNLLISKKEEPYPGGYYLIKGKEKNTIVDYVKSFDFLLRTY